ncbi:MAG: lipase family protein [Opitutae bacterium]|nr:lipase family protein [Opitutae bacterium]
MTLPTLIDVAIGLVLVFFILATLGSVLAEMWAAHQKLRHQILRDTVTRLLEPDIAEKFWAHPLIWPLYAQSIDALEAPDPAAPAPGLTARLVTSIKPQVPEAPAYLDAATFASVVLDLATGQGAAGALPTAPRAWEYAIRENVPAIPGENNDLQDRLLALLRQVPRDAADCGAELKKAVAHWYDEAMTRASGVYRRQLQKNLLYIGAGLALVLNCDALRIAYVLYQSPTLRTQVAQQAEALVQEKAEAGKEPVVAEGVGLKARLREDVAQLRDLTKIGFPLGWAPSWRDNFLYKTDPAPATPEQKKIVAMPDQSVAGHRPAAPGLLASIGSWFVRVGHGIARRVATIVEPGLAAYLAKAAGLFASALAVCLGAPFWFDLLGRLVKLRSSAGAEAEKKKTDAATSDAAGAPAGAKPAGAGGPGGPAGALAAAAAQPLPSAVEALAHPGTDFSTARAYWLAEFADRAYEPKREELERWLKLHGFTLLEFLDVQGTQGFLAKAEGVAVLAFRGTEQKLEDFVTDAEFKLIPGAALNVPGHVHHGFARALTSVAGRLDALVTDLKARRVLLHVTGHSLGGALATLAALRVARLKEACPIQTVHTFGSPRVGDETFVQAFDALFKGRSYRFVNDEDLVTRVPPRVGRYEHVGEIIFIDEAGRLQRDIGYWYRFLNFATNALGDLRQAIKTTVRDHSMKLYCGHLEKAARPAAPSR